jgi:hypothetical protein
MTPRSRTTRTALPLRHPAHLAAVAATAAAVVATVLFRRADPELWWQLAIGAQVLTGRFPAAAFGTWFDPGTPVTPPAMPFGVLLAGAWRALGEAAPLVLRSGLALAAFGVAALAAHRGAGDPHKPGRGASFALLALVAVCALAGRPALQAHPLQLAALWLALQLLALQNWRSGGRAFAWALPLLAMGWANTDASWPVGLGVTLCAVAAAWLRRDERARPLTLAALGAALASLAQPGGPAAAIEIADFVSRARTETLFRGLPDLRPLDWTARARDLVPPLLVAWPAAALFAPGPRPDRTSLLVSLLLGALAVAAERFLGLWAVACIGWLGRDLLRLGATAPAPRAPWVRGALAAAVCAAVAALALTDTPRRPGVGLDSDGVPVAAAQFMARHGLTGRGFNAAPYGSYLAWRAAGEPVPLPFVDMRFRGQPADRVQYMAAFVTDADWLRLHARHRFDWVLVERYQPPPNTLLDRLDADSSWALVFADDVAVLYARRDGADGALARALALGIPVGRRGYETFLQPEQFTTAQLDDRRVSLQRMIDDSPQHRLALTLLASTELALGLNDAAIIRVRDGLARWPRDPALRAMFVNLTEN